MTSSQFAGKAALSLEAIRDKSPLIHNITNYVVMNTTANALLACGASPVMAHAIEEVSEMASFASALVLNIGTLTPEWVEAMLLAGARANQVGAPVVLDPVGSGATNLRTSSAKRLVDQLDLAVVRGNPSEVLSLARSGSRTKGVDSIHSVEDAAEAAQTLALEIKTPVAITGQVDLVTDGKRVLRIEGGHPLMGRVTGTGCMATCLIGAFLAVEKDPVIAAAAALAYLGLAGEKAAEDASGPGSFQVSLFDALFNINPQDLESRARISG